MAHHNPSKSMKIQELHTARHGFPHLGHPSQKYSLNWKINQAGSGWLSLGNYFGYSTVLIKKREVRKPSTKFPRLQAAYHANIVGLVEAFHDNDAVFLAYNYTGLSVSFSQVIATPAVKLDETEIASICRSVLRGLEYLHEQLGLGHGNIDSSNTLLCSDGMVKIANIGDAMLEDGQSRFADDREKLASLLLGLGRSLSHSSNDWRDQSLNTTILSKYALHFIEHLGTASYSYLFEHVFLQQLSVDDRSWYLIPHYLETIMHWNVVTQ